MEERNIDWFSIWLARDKNGKLYLFYPKPSKGKAHWFTKGAWTFIEEINPEWYPNVKWSDKEPTEILKAK